MGGHFGGHNVGELADNVGNICLCGKGKSFKKMIDFQKFYKGYSLT